MITSAVLLAHSQAETRSSIRGRLQTRIAGGAEFASLYVDDIFNREITQARSWLRGAIKAKDLRIAAAAVGSASAVLLNAEGTPLAVLPGEHRELGQALAARYAHLRMALKGQRTVSNVVPSAVRSLPEVAFAVPFQSRSGLRVLSVVLAVAHSPLGAYFSHLVVTRGRRVYLIDGHGEVIAASNGSETSTLQKQSPSLMRALRHSQQGTATIDGVSRVFDSVAVPGTPWRVVATVPASALYSSEDGASQTLAWIGLAALAVSGLLIIVIVNGLARSRERLVELSGGLDRLARLDQLTGISNRRALDERLTQEASAATRSGQPLAVLMIDIDHFKQLNDTHGHPAGDRALISTSRRLADTLRAEDVLGRWGGEEFLVILPNTSLPVAAQAAERLRRAAAQPSPNAPQVTVTIGVAALSGDGIESLISRADEALYEGKRAGRNRVELKYADRPAPAPVPAAEPPADEHAGQPSLVDRVTQELEGSGPLMPLHDATDHG